MSQKKPKSPPRSLKTPVKFHDADEPTTSTSNISVWSAGAVGLSVVVAAAGFFLHKYKLNDQVDNTQILLRNAAPDRKIHYLHKLVMDTLKDVEIISQR